MIRPWNVCVRDRPALIMNEDEGFSFRGGRCVHPDVLAIIPGMRGRSSTVTWLGRKSPLPFLPWDRLGLRRPPDGLGGALCQQVK